jgi:hypothetical protein
MKTVLVATILAAGLYAAEPNARVPVLAELFTSEGCSSCPPADALLLKLDKMQPVAGAQIIVLSEHVDYWNYLGWSDRFSSAQFTQRQGAYTRALVAESYTPQMVVDGRKEVLGSDEKAIELAVAKAAARPKLPVRIVSAKRDDNQAVVSIAIGAASGKADVWVAIADDRDQSSVKNGENKGRTLNHVAVVRSLGKVGSVTKAAGLEKTVHVPLVSQAEGMRVVVFVAESGGPVIGSAMQELQ